jgi:hypothetical protein
VASDSNVWQEDLYNINDHSSQTAGGTINYIRGYMVCRTSVNTTDPTAYIHVKTEGGEHDGPTEVLNTNYATYTYQWNDNPETGNPWTWSEIDALQIGVGLMRPGAGEYAICTQVYIEVDFDAPPLSGSTPLGDMFEITTNGDYTGDMMVKFYLVDTENLTKAYQSISIELYLEGSVEAGETPDYRELTIQNGMVIFRIEDGGSGSHTLTVNGGSYTLTSRDISEWETDWSEVPEIYCEVVQR